MDISNTSSVRYNVTWQVMGETFVEVEVNCDEASEEGKLYETVSEIIYLAVGLGARVIVTSEKEPIRQFCLEILFRSNENKIIFLGKLPTVQ